MFSEDIERDQRHAMALYSYIETYFYQTAYAFG